MIGKFVIDLMKKCARHITAKRIGTFCNSIRLLKIISSLNTFVFAHQMEFQNVVYFAVLHLCVLEWNDNEIEMNAVQWKNRCFSIVMVRYY